MTAEEIAARIIEVQRLIHAIEQGEAESADTYADLCQRYDELVKLRYNAPNQ